MRESQLKNSTVRFIRKAYPGAWIYHPSDKWIAGIPDILGCLDGRFFAIELKMKYNKPSKIQKYVMAKIEAAGGLVAVCYSLNEVKIFMDEVGK